MKAPTEFTGKLDVSKYGNLIVLVRGYGCNLYQKADALKEFELLLSETVPKDKVKELIEQAYYDGVIFGWKDYRNEFHGKGMIPKTTRELAKEYIKSLNL